MPPCRLPSDRTARYPIGVISRLALSDFRNHADLVVEPGAGFVVLTGPNGAGKTNILEAVSMLSPGRGLRRAPLRDMSRANGPGGFAVAARLADGNELGTGTKPAAPDRRQLFVNGAAQPLSALAEHLSVLWLTPAMDRIFMEGASERRRFLDRLVLALEPAHATHATRYEAAMRARTKLLTDEQQRPDQEWLTALEARMAEHGQALADARARSVAALSDALAWQAQGDFPRASLALEGCESMDLAATLYANRARDTAAARATEGPHRQDLIVQHLEKSQAAALGSTGEQKALLIGLVLAHAELVAERRNAPPILLLDEVAAHLDPDRRAALYRRLEGRGQVWMTGTEPALFDEAGDASRFTVMDGAVVPA